MGSGESTCCCSCSKRPVQYKPIEKAMNASRHKQDRSSDTNHSNNQTQTIQNDILKHQSCGGEVVTAGLLSHHITADTNDSQSETQSDNEKDTQPIPRKRRTSTFIVDFSVFESNSKRCFGEESIVIPECHALYRLIHGLEYYLSLNIPYDAVRHRIFVAFCADTYNNILHDYIHVMSIHSKQFDVIKAQISDYNVSQKLMSTHNAIPKHQNGEYVSISRDHYDAMFIFYRDLFHGFHNGLLCSTHDQTAHNKQWIHPKDVMDTYKKVKGASSDDNCDVNESQSKQIFTDNFKDIVNIYLNMNTICYRNNLNTRNIAKAEVGGSTPKDANRSYTNECLLRGYIRSASSAASAIYPDAILDKISTVIAKYYVY